jgi:hypothetical protein
MPEFDPFLRDELVGSAPQPLAEALAALDGVRNVHQARTAVFAAARVTARLVGMLALAAQLAAHAPRPVAGTRGRAVRRLRRHGLADDEWLWPSPRTHGAGRSRADAGALVSPDASRLRA